MFRKQRRHATFEHGEYNNFPLLFPSRFESPLPIQLNLSVTRTT
jgi:hypothetical protein